LINTKDNGAIGDKTFADKRPVIEKSKNILLTLDVLDRTKSNPTLWDGQLIAERQEMMADLAVQRWPLKGK